MSYQSPLAIPPARIVRTCAINRGIEDRIAEELNMSEMDFERFLIGEIHLDEILTGNISELFGGTVEFWLSLENQYRDDLKRIVE